MLTQLRDAETIILKNSFIPYVGKEWNRLSTETRNSTSCQELRKSLLSFIVPICSSLFSIHHHVGVKLLARLRLGFSHLREHKFRHNFHNTMNTFALPFVQPQHLFRSFGSYE